ncbi:MAG: sigma-54 dependent transcriptional regulator [Pseudomonadota bacterium]
MDELKPSSRYGERLADATEACPPAVIDTRLEAPVRGNGQRRQTVRGARPASKSARPTPKKPSSATLSGRSHKMIGSSRAMQELRAKIERFAPVSEPVLVIGETGVGKEGVAQALHSLSKRVDRPFVVRNAGRIDASLVGSEFFGHVRGAFTGAESKRAGSFLSADNGTLVLDEIGELPIELQANFLRVLEEGAITPLGADNPLEVDVRIIAATNRDLPTACAKGEFRWDLYHRLNVLRIDVPPLRRRGDDVVEIADYWLSVRANETGQKRRLTPAAADKLLKYHWPGNIRELRNVIIRADILTEGDAIHPDQVSFETPRQECLNIEEGRKLVAKYLAALALSHTNGNVKQAALLADLNRTSFHNLKTAIAEENETVDSLGSRLRSFLGM